MRGLFTKILAGGLFMAAPAVAPSAEGVASKPSPYSVADTTRRLEETVRSKGLTVLARIDHGGGARSAGLTTQAAALLAFGNARAGTRPIVARPPRPPG